MMEILRWTFISNHGLALSYIFNNPSHKPRRSPVTSECLNGPPTKS